MATEWQVYKDDDGMPHLVIKDGETLRPATLDECESASRILNEQGSNIIRLICKTISCKDKGGWIERTREDANKNVYKCDVCGQAMSR